MSLVDRCSSCHRLLGPRSFGSIACQCPPGPPLHHEDCPTCYGNGCTDCAMTGRVETAEGRADREEAEDRRADEARERRLLGDD